MADTPDFNPSAEHPELGTLKEHAVHGGKMSPFGKVVAFGAPAIGIAVMVYGFMEGEGALIGFGVLGMLPGLLFAFLSWLDGPKNLALYEKGLMMDDDTVLWSDVTEATAFEWYDDRTSPLTYNIVLKAKEGDEEKEYRTNIPADGIGESIMRRLANYHSVEVVPF